MTIINMAKWPVGPNFDPFFIGFDNVIKRMNTFTENGLYSKSPTYPPYNIRKVSDNIFVIELAVAGFSKKDIDIDLQGDILKISGKTEIDSNKSAVFVHRGIAERAFERNFTLSETIIIKSADLSDGMLKITLENIIPEVKQSRKIIINEPKSKREFLTEERNEV